METETRYGLDGTTVYVWGDTKDQAISKASAFTGIPQLMLAANRTGLVRPGTYEMAFDDTEMVGNTLRRYAVTGKA